MKKLLKLFTMMLVAAPAFTQAFALSTKEVADLLSAPSGRLGVIKIEGGIVYETLQMRKLYMDRNYQPLWLEANGFSPRLKVVRDVLQNSFHHGFVAKTFWGSKIEGFYNTHKGMTDLEFEMAISEAILRWARSVNVGLVDPALVDDDIKLTAKTFTEAQISQLRGILEGAPDLISKSLEAFEPQIPLYQTLKLQLQNPKAKFTQDQKNKIAATMEKLRWFPHELGERFGFVNLAMTEMKVVEKGNVVLSMKTINGRPVRRTPMLVDAMKRVEINPTWTVPLNLAIWDKLPKIRADLGFLERNHIKVFHPGSGSPITDVGSIDWNALSRENFPYILQQQAGPGNVLGQVKFPLTNGFSIYMHDTDERNLFAVSAPRLRSSGCVRLQKPMEMAAYLLKDQPVPAGKGWLDSNGNEYPEGTLFTEAILQSRVARANNSVANVSTVGITVDRPLPLYTAYLTADVDEKGGVSFVQDQYKQDARLLGIMNNFGTGSSRPQIVDQNYSPKLVPVQIRGELGPTQLFGNVVAIRCSVWPYKGCVDVADDGKTSREETRFHINEEVYLKAGYYLLAYENTILPGWFEVQCYEDELSVCAPVAITLEKIFIPDTMAQADEVFVYRDMSTVVEQNKILSQSFHNGEALIKQTPVNAKNFYVSGVNQMDVVQRLNTDFCLAINDGKVKDVAPEVRKYCEGLSEVVGMAEYLDLPVLVQNEDAEGTSDQVKAPRAMKVFQFPSKDGPAQTSAQWGQRWVGAPGNWMNFTHRRYLVAAPMFPKNIKAERRFVTVLPGQYRILGVNAEGNAIAQTSIRTENIDENYERIARKVVLGEE